MALALPDKHRAMSTFRGHIQGRSIVFEVAAIFATVWLLKQVASPHLLAAVGFIGGLHLSGLEGKPQSSGLSLDRASGMPRVWHRGVAAWRDGEWRH